MHRIVEKADHVHWPLSRCLLILLQIFFSNLRSVLILSEDASVTIKDALLSIEHQQMNISASKLEDQIMRAMIYIERNTLSPLLRRTYH